MRTFDTKKEYYYFVHNVAENNLEHDGSDPTYVANHVLHALQKIDDDEYAQVFNGEPYTSERTVPSEVHKWSDCTLQGNYDDDSYRGLAVELLAVDIQFAQSEIQTLDDNRKTA